MKTKLFLIISFFTLMFASGDDPANKLYIKAYDYVLDQDWDNAIVTFKKIIDEYPKSVFYDDSHFWVAYSYNEKGELEQAFELYGQFIEKFSTSNLADDATRNRIRIAKDLYKQGNQTYQQYIDESGAVEKDLSRIELQKAVIYQLYKKGGSEEVNSLKRIILSDDYNYNVRKEAMHYFYKSKDASLIEKITEELLREIKDPKIRKDLVYNVYRSKKIKAKAFLLKVAVDNDESYQMRKEAVYYFYKLKDFDGLKTVYLQSHNDFKLQKEIIYNLYKLKDDDSVDFLIKILKLKPTPNKIKKEIIYYLGKLNSTKARRAINDIIE